MDVNKYWHVDALFTSAVFVSGLSPLFPGRFSLWKEPQFPLNSFLLLPIADPGSFVPDRIEVLIPGIFFFFFLGPVCISSGNTSAFKAYCDKSLV
jgi:hypothetical protein